MRQSINVSRGRHLALIAFAIACAVMLMAPAIAQAATPHSTIKLSTTYQSKAATFTISGAITKSVAGKYLAVQIRKPGRAHWTTVGSAKVSSKGTFAYKYRPKLGGTFYVRTWYGGKKGTGLSRTASLRVSRGPGVKYKVFLASTTSTRDSGLFERLGPAFEANCPEYDVVPVFVGSGAAIALGGTGDADVLLTHSPAAEVNFMKGIVNNAPSAFRGKTRYKVMYNDFLLVGPTANPAGISADATAGAAFKALADTGSTFWSRADNSGTNAKEKEIWASIGNPQTGQLWYKSSGAIGMAQALSNANTDQAYTLADRGTWLNISSLGAAKNLKVINEKDPSGVYNNQYAVIEVNKARNAEGALEFSTWIRSAYAQGLIKSYGEYTYPGQQLFVPNAGSYPW